jgi:endonuclease-3
VEPSKQAGNILSRLEKEYHENKGTSLTWRTPLDLLVATILSAQSTDEQINKVTKVLFKKYRTARDYAEADRVVFEEDIKPSGFFKRKADWIQSATKTILEEYNGEVPDNMEDLLQLKGVARKTANIVLQNAFNKTVGIAVDTHVMRLSRRLKFSDQKDRNKIEQDLMKLIPFEKWKNVNFLLITHGRQICTARKPLCSKCVIDDLCPSAFTFPHNLLDNN